MMTGCINEATEITSEEKFRNRVGFERQRATWLLDVLNDRYEEETGASPSVDLALELSDNDLRLIAACIAQALVLVEDWEFHTRIGFTPEEVAAFRLGILDDVKGASL